MAPPDLDRDRDRDRERDRDRIRIPWRDRIPYDDRRPPPPPSGSAPLPPNPYSSARRSRSPPYIPSARYRSPPRREYSPPLVERNRVLSGGDVGRRRDSPEPGQIVPSREREKSPPRRPYAPRTVDRVLSRSHSPEMGVSTAEALKLFSNAMHSTLVSTSTHALALQHFTRLATFPQSDPTSTPFEDAQKRVADAEKSLNDSMIKLQGTFAELIRRTMAKPGVAQGDVGGLELDALKERMGRLEQLDKQISSSAPVQQPTPLPTTASTSTPATITQAGPSSIAPTDSYRPQVSTQDANPISTSSTAPETERRRERLRDMLDEIITRLESVEEMRDGLEERYNDLENQLDVWVGADIDKPVTSWEVLENKRDPSGRLRGLEMDNNVVTGRQEREEVDMAHVVGSERLLDKGKGKEVIMDVDMGSEAAAVTRDDSQLLELRQELYKLQKRVNGATNNTSSDDLNNIRSELQKLDGEVKSIKRDSSVLDEIPRIRTELNALADSSSERSNTISSTLLRLNADIGKVQTDLRTFGEVNNQRTMVLTQQVTTLQEEVKTLRNDMKGVIDGREEWTKEVMTVCLNAVKEDLQEEYAKIAKREIQSYVKDFMARRAPATAAAKRTPEPSVSPAVRPGTLPPSNPMTTQSAPQTTVALPNASFGVESQLTGPTPTPVHTNTPPLIANSSEVQRAHSNPAPASPLVARISDPQAPPESVPISTPATQTGTARPLSARMNSAPLSTAQSQADLRARLSNPLVNGVGGDNTQGAQGSTNGHGVASAGLDSGGNGI